MKIFSVFMVIHILHANIKCAHGLMRNVGNDEDLFSLCKANKEISKNFIKNCSKEYKHKTIHTSTKRYKDGGDMEKLVLDSTYILIHQKQGLTTTDVRDVEGSFVVKLRAQKVDRHFFIPNYL